jgi:ATP-dependent RNA helicase DeaD
MTSFIETGLQDNIIQAVQDLGFEKPTPIQIKTIPHLLSSDQDLVAFAQTGTGKTAAFGLPVIQLTDGNNKNTQTLILCPTRELCLQITRDMQSFAKYRPDVAIVAVYGGASIETQIKALNKGAQVVVATPGRARDLIKRRKLNLGNLSRLILDEADEMLNMGFKEEIDEILISVPEQKQSVLYSATMSKDIKNIAKKYMNQPAEFSVAAANAGAENVNHIFYLVQAKDRYETLKRIADINPDIYGIVFCRTRKDTMQIADKLMQDGYNADSLHGELTQAQRNEVMGRFRSRHLQMLVATDVAARGLDVNDLTHVINYNLPDDNEGYVHRSGRTGRAGKSGTSIAIIHKREINKIKDIEKSAKVSFKKEAVPTGKDICQKQLFNLIDKIEKTEINEEQIAPFLPDIFEKLSWLSREELIKHFVSAEFNRFLAYYQNARDLNAKEEKSKGKQEKGRQQSEGFTRMFINAGSKDNLHPARLLGIINDSLDSADTQIGRIEILRKFSFFEIENGMENQVMQALNGQDLDGTTLAIEISKEKPAEEKDKKALIKERFSYQDDKKWKRSKKKKGHRVRN